MKYYTEDHFWLEVIDGEATIGITGYGVRELGDILSIRLPAEGMITLWAMLLQPLTVVPYMRQSAAPSAASTRFWIQSRLC